MSSQDSSPNFFPRDDFLIVTILSAMTKQGFLRPFCSSGETATRVSHRMESSVVSRHTIVDSKEPAPSLWTTTAGLGFDA